MKRFMDEDLFKRFNRKNHAVCAVAVVVVGILLAVATVLVVFKLKNKNGCCCGDFDDDFEEEFDENGCRYTDDDDFED